MPSSTKLVFITVHAIDTCQFLLFNLANSFRPKIFFSNFDHIDPILSFSKALPAVSMLTVTKRLSKTDNLSVYLFNRAPFVYNTNLVSDFKTENPTFENYGISLVKGILPEYFHSRWSFTQFHIPEIKTYSIFDKTKQIIYSFGSDGQYYILDFHDKSKPTIERTIRYISDESDPFSERSSTIK